MPGKILVVDDQAGCRDGLQVLLGRLGFEVRTAADGPSALKTCQLFKPDLVLLDVMIPGLDGFEVCRRLKSAPETMLTPVVLVTVLTATNDRVRGIEAGADDFLSKPLDPSELVARVRSLLKLKSFTDEMENAEAVLFSLALSIEGRDPCTAGHCARLAQLSAQLAARVGLAGDEVKALRRAGIVHDIGKVTVPDAVLLKRGPLTPGEQQLMAAHPAAVERICSPLKSFRLVLPVIRHHHEKLDGSGYPDRLAGEEIPLTARILQIVDIYDALTTVRPYRYALPHHAALELMTEEVRRGWWDRRLFDEFRGLLAHPGAEVSPPGSPPVPHPGPRPAVTLDAARRRRLRRLSRSL
jgi:putative two-component system response regulator